MNRQILKIGLAVVENGCVLLVRKKGGDCYILPGGKPEQGENDLRTLIREIDEELGCALDEGCVKYVGEFRDRAADLSNMTVVVKLYTGSLIGKPSPRSEIEELIWFDPRSSAKAELAPSLENSILPHLFKTTRQSEARL